MNRRERRDQEAKKDRMKFETEQLSNERLHYYYRRKGIGDTRAYETVYLYAGEILRLRGIDPDTIEYEEEKTEQVKRTAIMKNGEFVRWKDDETSEPKRNVVERFLDKHCGI